MILGLLGGILPPLVAQHGRPRKPTPSAELPPDPYTEADPTVLMAAAGELSHGPFPWADHHGTRKIEEALGDVAPIWIETAHFKLGCTLSAYKIPPGDKVQRDKVRAELEDLAQVLPAVDPKTRRLDRWLRAHLYAQRLERIYSDLEGVWGVEDQDFPTAPGRQVGADYRGEGPYLGQRGKYLILLFEKESSFARYWGRFVGGAGDRPMRHNFAASDSLFFGTAAEFFDGFLKDDTALHAHLALAQSGPPLSMARSSCSSRRSSMLSRLSY